MSTLPPVSRRDALKMIGAGVATLALGDVVGCARGPRRPNIVIVITDDVRFDAMGCAGDRRLQTPNLDRLAARGMRFTQGYAACPVCSRASTWRWNRR